jgi:hypothetical protein
MRRLRKSTWIERKIGGYAHECDAQNALKQKGDGLPATTL